MNKTHSAYQGDHAQQFWAVIRNSTPEAITRDWGFRHYTRIHKQEQSNLVAVFMVQDPTTKLWYYGHFDTGRASGPRCVYVCTAKGHEAKGPNHAYWIKQTEAARAALAEADAKLQAARDHVKDAVETADRWRHVEAKQEGGDA